MLLRKAHSGDFESIASLHIESWKNTYRNDFPRQFLDYSVVETLQQHWAKARSSDNNIIVIVAEQHSEIVGFGAVLLEPVPIIDNLHVKQASQAKNVGTLLMRRIAEVLIARGKVSGYLWVFASNQMAISFYQKLGGLVNEVVVKDIFGYKIECRKIQWPDLSVIVTDEKSILL